MRRREYWTFLAPSLIVMFGLLIVPLYRTIVWSFQDVSYGQPGTWVGLDNYRSGLSDPRWIQAILFTVGLTIVSTVIILVLGYVLATMINRLGRMRPVVLGIMLISYVIPQVVGAAAFSWLFDSNFGGVINLLVTPIVGHEVLWFTDPWPNRVIVTANVVWSMLPFAMLMIMAALQSVPEELLDAAKVDGANLWQRHRNVIIPSIRGVLGFVGLICTMDIVRIFDNLVPLSPSAITIGNESLMMYIYNIAFREGSPRLGLGSAMSVLMLIIILTLLYPSIRGILKEASGRA